MAAAVIRSYSTLSQGGCEQICLFLSLLSRQQQVNAADKLKVTRPENGMEQQLDTIMSRSFSHVSIEQQQIDKLCLFFKTKNVPLNEAFIRLLFNNTSFCCDFSQCYQKLQAIFSNTNSFFALMHSSTKSILGNFHMSLTLGSDQRILN